MIIAITVFYTAMGLGAPFYISVSWLVEQTAPPPLRAPLAWLAGALAAIPIYGIVIWLFSHGQLAIASTIVAATLSLAATIGYVFR